MKLRIKTTGEIVDAYSIDAQNVETIKIQYFTKNGKLDHFSFNSLEELNNVLEDYKPAEPLIKDEKIRKAVRAWADASGIEKVLSYGGMYWIGFRSTNTASVWKFECNYIDGSEFKLDKEYTIAELCGEEEE